MSQSACLDQDSVEALQERYPSWPDTFVAFKTTQWSVVIAAGDACSHAAQCALEQLCRAYWFPLYAFVRRHGHSPEDAQDLTQEFFARFLGKNYFARADRARGKFRTFLLVSLKHFLHEEWRRSCRQKRGGGEALVPLDTTEAESRMGAESGTELTPDRLFDRRWAEAVLDAALARLRADYSATGRANVYEQLQQFLWGRESGVSYAEMGIRLQMNEGAVKVAVHRLRQRFRDLLRDEVERTVESAGDVEEELQYLMGVFGR